MNFKCSYAFMGTRIITHFFASDWLLHIRKKCTFSHVNFIHSGCDFLFLYHVWLRIFQKNKNILKVQVASTVLKNVNVKSHFI